MSNYRDYYARNTERERARVRAYHQIARDRLIEYKESRSCADCGKFFPHYVMDFDHLSDKSFTISERKNWSWARLEAEIQKCEVVCANCHRVRTWNRMSPPSEDTAPTGDITGRDAEEA